MFIIRLTITIQLNTNMRTRIIFLPINVYYNIKTDNIVPNAKICHVYVYKLCQRHMSYRQQCITFS